MTDKEYIINNIMRVAEMAVEMEKYEHQIKEYEFLRKIPILGWMLRVPINNCIESSTDCHKCCSTIKDTLIKEIDRTLELEDGD